MFVLGGAGRRAIVGCITWLDYSTRARRRTDVEHERQTAEQRLMSLSTSAFFETDAPALRIYSIGIEII
jgi:hypothetical protein